MSCRRRSDRRAIRLVSVDRYRDEAVGHDQHEVAALLQLIADGWDLCDDRDEDDHLVLVDEARNTHPIVRPAKPFVMKLVEKGLIQFEEWSERPGGARQYVPVPSGYSGPSRELDPVPFVYSFRVTPDGLELAAKRAG